MAKERYALGFDLGKNLGVAIAKANDGGDIYTCHATTVKDLTKLDLPKTCNLYQRYLKSIMDNVQVVTVEKIGFNPKGMYQSQIYFAMLGILYAECCERGIRIIEVPVQTLRKAACGTSKGVSKADVCAAAHELGWAQGRIGTDYENDAADAFFSMKAGLSKEGVLVKFEGF